MRKGILFMILLLTLGLVFFNYEANSVVVESKDFEAGSYTDELEVGIYKTNDNKHTITVNEDGTVLYDNLYSLTVNLSDKGYTLTGKLGSNKVSFTFYQVNDSSIISMTTKSYTENSETVYLYDYTGFKLDVSPVENTSGIFELYRNDTKVATYTDLQSAVDSASSGDTIKITEDYKVTSGVYVDKKLTIDGGNHTLNRSEWNHSVFVIDTNGDLTLKNMTIDGGAVNFEVDFDSVTYKDYYIPLKSGSLDNDPKLTLSAVIVRGNLVTDNVNVNNNYTISNGGAISIVSGSATLRNSNFNHNFGNTYGGAINVGSNLSERTSYPVSSFVVENCDFDGNYVANSNNATKFGVGHGGAINVFNTTKVEISESDFYGNIAYYGKGGALNFRDESTSNIVAETLGLDFIQATITDSVFENNWAGNDGFAIQSYAADLYIDGSTFRKNVGTHPSSSVGTVSIESYRANSRIYSSIKNSVFEENIGPVSGFGDHSSLIDADFENVTFKGNVGSETVLLYSAVSNFKNCKFIDEDAKVGVIDARIYENYDIPPTMTLDNVSFEGTIGPTDILIRKNKHNMELNTYNVVLSGDTSANVDVWDNNKLTILGTYEGVVKTDGETLEENVVVDDDASFTGTIVSNPNTYTLTLYYPLEDDAQSTKYLYLERDKTYTQAELYLMTFLDKDGYTLKYYTDNTYTTAWDYTVNGHLTVYGKWEEHTHEFLGNLVAYNNVIYEQCGCGSLGKSLSLVVPTDLVYNGKEKGVTIQNNLSNPSDEYTLKYQYKDKDGNFVDMEGVPVKVGTYKAVLTYEGMTIELDYDILEVVSNPNTGISLPYIILGMVAICSVLVITVYRKKRFM